MPGPGPDARETETVSWLVKYHLLMSKTAFRYDLNDPKTIQDFTECRAVTRTFEIASCSDSRRTFAASDHIYGMAGKRH